MKEGWKLMVKKSGQFPEGIKLCRNRSVYNLVKLVIVLVHEYQICRAGDLY